MKRMSGISISVALICFLLVGCRNNHMIAGSEQSQPRFKKEVLIDATHKFQTIDGFGVNINPAQWHNGNLKKAIDLLTDDLGCTLFRFDAYGQADWLDPQMQKPDKSFPAAYLEQVYTNKQFSNAWACFHYLNQKGIEPVFNISGKVPPAWAEGQHLTDFESYAEMAVSMLKWARDKENLHFSLFMPFNETDLGYPEGPKLDPENCTQAVSVLIDKMKRAGLDDVKLIVMGDSHPVLEKVKVFLNDSSFVNNIYAFSMHTYGNGLDEDNRGPWPYGPSPFQTILSAIDHSPYKGTPVWLSEYGDLDLTNEIEFEFAWRSVRRLLRALNDGVSAGLVWDAFDNFHKHDSAWTTFGLLRTDTVRWEYTPRKRYYGAKQIFKYIRPGFQRVGYDTPQINPHDPYARLRQPLRNILLSVYAGPDLKDFTITGMSLVEGDVTITFHLKGFPETLNGRTVQQYRTGRHQNFEPAGKVTIKRQRFSVHIKERSIFTLTTLK